MGTRLSASVSIAVALIVLPLAMLAGYGRWLATRNFIPLDVPVSLSPGHIRTDEFKINVKGTYFVKFDVDYPFAYESGCQLAGPDSVVKSHFVITHEGRVIEEREGLEYFFVAEFEADEKGLYRLDIDVLSDASCLNAGHPRLSVSTPWGSYTDFEEEMHWLSIIPIVAGLGLMGRTISSLNWKTRGMSHDRLLFERSDLAQGSWLPRFAGSKPISTLPSFGFFCGTVLSFVVIAYMMFYATHPLPKGLPVLIATKDLEVTATGVTEPPIVVRVEDMGPGLPDRLYVNSRLVTPSSLENALRDELKRRPDWIVSVEADPNLPWMAVADAVDAIKEVQAKAVLRTPETSEWMRQRYTEDVQNQSDATVHQHRHR